MRLQDVAGQPRAVEILTRALETGKLAHAYLFEGISGCGKMTTALALVEAVFCGRASACGECPSCKKMRNQQHPDLHIVEPDGQSIKIDQIRELQKALSYRPFEAPKKCCIINQADRMNPAAGNALLKTLEEPPGDALLILITENREAVLPTILSRCQPLQFSPLSEEVVRHLLQHDSWDAERASVAAAMADGSLTAARRFADETTAVERGTILRDVLSLPAGEAARLLALAERLAPSKEQAIVVTETLLALFRDMVLLKAGEDKISNADLKAELSAEAAKRQLPLLIRGTEAITDIRRALLRNANPRLAMEVLFIRLADLH